MAFAPLICKGAPKINSTDVSLQVTAITFKGSRETIDIPATFGARSSKAAGDDTYEVEISLLQDTDATAVADILWTELATTNGTITVEATLRAGAVSETNPKYTGTAIVTGWELGGEVNSVGVLTVTLPLTGRPTKATT